MSKYKSYTRIFNFDPRDNRPWTDASVNSFIHEGALMTHPLPVTASFLIELNATVEGVYQPYIPATGPSYASGGDPPSGDYCEDVAIAELTISVRDHSIPTPTTPGYWREVNILKGVDTSNPHVIRLLSNILDCVMGEAQEELREAAADFGSDERADDE